MGYEDKGKQMKRAAVYIRISSNDQKTALQDDELPEYCQYRKWQIVETYTDVLTGSKDRRPALDRLMMDAHRRKFDVVLIWKFDRFARNTRFLLEAVETFLALGIDFVSFTENLDTTTPMGKAVVTILGALGELERSNIRERVIAGQRAAKRRGVRFGRPTREIDRIAVEKLRATGKSWREVAAQLNVAKNTLIRHCASV